MNSRPVTAADALPPLANGHANATPPLGRGSLSVVLPVYNERDNLESLDAEIRRVLHAMGRPCEIIYVDDCSTDDSFAVLQRLAAEGEPTIPTIAARLNRNYGQTAAMSAGFELARGEIILPLDADGQNDPADIPRLVERLERDGVDVVSGWRRQRRDKTITRVLPSRIANWMIGRASGVKLHDYGCTLKAYRACYLKQLRLYGDMHRFIPLYLGILGAKVVEQEVNHRPRRAGVSKYGPSRIFKVLFDLFLIRFMTRYQTKPMHFFGQTAQAFLTATGLVFVFMVALKYGLVAAAFGVDWSPTFIETPLPGLAATFFLGAVMSIFFGILAEILIRVRFESNDARPYALAEVIASASTTPTTLEPEPKPENCPLNRS